MTAEQYLDIQALSQQLEVDYEDAMGLLDDWLICTSEEAANESAREYDPYSLSLSSELKLNI